MARHFFGLGPSDFAMQAQGVQLVLSPNTPGTVWDSQSGGNQYTDLQDASFQPISVITSDTNGRVGFYGPDGISACWVDFGFGRFLLVATDLGTQIDNLAAGKLDLAGGTMTGTLTLATDPAAALQAATKQYVDAETSRATSAEATLTSSKVSKAGDVMTGALTLSGDPSTALQAATKQYVDTAVGAINVKSPAYGAVGDGTTNDAPAIQAALNVAATTPGVRIVIPPGTYKINAELELKGSCWLDLVPGATIKRGSSSMEYMVRNFNSSYGPTLYNGRGGIRITGGVWDADGGNLTGSVTILIFAHAKDILVERATFRNVRDWHAIELNSTQDGTVDRCIFEGFKVFTAGRHISEAIQIDLAQNSTALPDIGADAYDSTPCDNISITRCTVRAYGSLTSFGALTGSHNSGDGHKQTRIRVINNFGDGLADYMVNATNWDDVVIAGNECVNSNSFAAVQLPASPAMTADMFRAVIADNIVFNSGVANANPSVNANCILIQGIDAAGAGNVIRDVTIENNVLHTIGNTTAAITAFNVGDLVINGGSIKSATANGISVRGCRTANINAVKFGSIGTKAIVVWDGTNIASTGTAVTACTVDGVSDHAIDISSQACEVANCIVNDQATSGKACLRCNATDLTVVGNNFWRRGGSASSNGIQVETTATSCYFATNRLKGWGTTTSTGASGVTGTAVWAVSGTAALDPVIGSFTTGSINKITTAN